jgi:glutathione S-transferase
VAAAGWAGLDLMEFPLVKAYYERLLTRPSIERGMNVPELHPVRALMNDEQKLAEFTEYSRSWVLLGMSEDAKALAKREG